MANLHHKTLEAAVNKYSPLVAEGKAEEEIRKAIAADEKEFEPEAIDEIYAAITNPDAGKDKADKKKRFVVKNEFRDIANFNQVHAVGTDVSHFDKERLKRLVELGHVIHQ